MVLAVLAGIPLGFVLAVVFDSPKLWLLGLMAPTAIYSLVAAAVARRRNETPDPVGSASRERSDLSVALLCVLGGTAIAIVGTYLKVFWAIALIGIAMTASLWKYRESGAIKGGIAFLGVLVALYGILGQIVLWVVRQRAL